MTMSVHQSEERITRLMRRVRQMLLILAIVLVVIAVLFLIVYGLAFSIITPTRIMKR
jgi:flagellar biosynthesis/type III secretory pathway M-ring protein FliF/YscJ